MEKIRKATIDDSYMLAKVHLDSFKACYRNIIPEEVLSHFTVAKREHVFKDSIKQEGGNTYLVEGDGKIYGFVTFGRCRDFDSHSSGEIWGLYVGSKYWKKGYGKKLLEYAEKWLNHQGYKKIYIWALKDNLPAIKFYEHFGYKSEGSRKTLGKFGGIESLRYFKDL